MEFHHYAATEASTLIARLLQSQSGACAQQLQAVREALDAAAHALTTPAIPEHDIHELAGRLTEAAAADARRAGEEAQRISGEARRAIDEAHAALQQQIEENGRLAEMVVRSNAETALLKSELQTAMERTDAAERDLLTTMEAHGTLESALQHAENDRRHAAEAIARLEQELTGARATVERATGDAAELRRELHDRQGERASAERHLAAAQEFAGQRDALARELEATVTTVRALERDLAAAHTALEHHDVVATELEMSKARAHTLEAQRAEHEEQLRGLQVRLDEALNAETKLREAVARASDSAAGDEQQTEALRWELERMVSLFDASVRAVNEMASARTAGDLLSELVKRLSIQFSRVALFKVKAHGLESEQQIGFEDRDFARLVLPVTVDSLLTRAVHSGLVESVTGSDIASRLGTPFGGTPTSAVALPIVLQGTTLAVVYADDADMPDSARGPAVHEASVGFAKLLVGEAAVLLMCHTHELKTLAELRQYALTLLQEAKAMYVADTEANKPPAVLRARLKDNLECASQLYAYRAAMEGSAAAVLFDEQVAQESGGATPFARDLAEVVQDQTSSDLGITAEAS